MAKKDTAPAAVQEQVKDKKQLIDELVAKAKNKGSLTYTEVSEFLGNIELDKDEMDDMYEQLLYVVSLVDER